MWKFGDRIPANQLIGITEDHETGPVSEATLPLYHHAGAYDTAVEQLTLLCKTLGVSTEILAGGNIVVVLGPDRGINVYRG